MKPDRCSGRWSDLTPRRWLGAASPQRAGVSAFHLSVQVTSEGNLNPTASFRLSATGVLPFLFEGKWCSGQDSNLHALRHGLLRPACLPFHHPSENTALCGHGGTWIQPRLHVQRTETVRKRKGGNPTARCQTNASGMNIPPSQGSLSRLRRIRRAQKLIE